MSNLEHLLEKKPYIGSVRFFKHLILSCVGLAILIPVCISIGLGIKVHTLHVFNTSLEQQNGQLSGLLENTSSLLENLQIIQAQKITAQDTYAGDSKDNPNWQLLLVNDWHPLSSDFEVTLSPVANGQQVDARVAGSLTDMINAMQQAKLHPVICSSYRSVERQTELFQEYIDQRISEGMDYKDAFYSAKKRLATPGTSEHQTGLAVDIVGESHQNLDDAQADTEEAKWLKEHCAEYGFILRYPENKTAITGVDYESWHFRYVGKEAASFIMEHELTLEEYLKLIG